MGNQPNPKLLTKNEQNVCRQIALSDENLAGKRAKALLALNEGVTRAISADGSGLTIGQVRYLVGAFTKKRLAIFPDDIIHRLPSSENQIKTSKDKKKSRKKNKKNDKDKKMKKSRKNKSDKNKKSKKKK